MIWSPVHLVSESQGSKKKQEQVSLKEETRETGVNRWRQVETGGGRWRQVEAGGGRCFFSVKVTDILQILPVTPKGLRQFQSWIRSLSHMTAHLFQVNSSVSRLSLQQLQLSLWIIVKHRKFN